MDVAYVDRAIREAGAKLRNAARGVISRAIVENGRLVLQLSGLAGETLRDVPAVQQYGFLSRPKSGADAVVLFLGHAPNARLVIATHDRRYTLTGLAEGDVALFTDTGDKVHLGRSGITIESTGNVSVQAAGNAEVKAAGTATVEGSQVLLGEGAIEQAILGTSFSLLFNGHTHLDPITGVTGTPITPMTGSHLSTKVKVG